MDSQMKAAVIGSVSTTEVAIKRLLSSQIELVGVLGLEREDHSSISAYTNLRAVTEAGGVPYVPFSRVNESWISDLLSDWSIDYLFVVGLSQLVHDDLLSTAKVGCIGYHPTRLPMGRGRAPIAWLVLNAAPAASTLFEIGREADSGGILAQVEFAILPAMDAGDVLAECERTLECALDELLPKLENGQWNPSPQDDALATFLGKRERVDGFIDWTTTARDIDGLIRAAAPPHPGAYCYFGNEEVRILKSHGVIEDSQFRGVPGRVLHRTGDSYDVQCGVGVVRISCVTDGEGELVHLRPGSNLQMLVPDCIHDLQQRVAHLEQLVARLSPLA